MLAYQQKETKTVKVNGLAFALGLQSARYPKCTAKFFV
jgi:hypothetical protein